MKKSKILSLLTLPLVLVGTGTFVSYQLSKSGSKDSKIYKIAREASEEVSNGLKIKDFSGGTGYAGAVVTDSQGNDSLYTWGNNAYNKLGIGSSVDYTYIPKKVNIPSGYKIKDLEVGNFHSGAIATDGYGIDHLYMWGRNTSGQVGVGSTSNQEDITEIHFSESQLKDISIAEHSSAIVATNTLGNDILYTWGSNNQGLLGIGTTTVGYKMSPYRNNRLDSNLQINELEFGGYHAGITTTDLLGNEGLYMWGYNVSGQLAYSTSYTKVYSPLLVDDFSSSDKFSNLELGRLHSSVVVENLFGEKSIYTWGESGYGQLGNGGTSDKSIPVKIASFTTNSNVKISAKYEHNSAIVTDKNDVDHLYMWGLNDRNQINSSLNDTILSPTKIVLPEEGKITSYLGSKTSYAVVDDKFGQQHLYVWGNNDDGELGIGLSNPTISSPQENNVLINNPYATSTSVVELVSDEEFIFQISSPVNKESKADDVEVYNTKGVKVGTTTYLEDEKLKSSEYRFDSVIEDFDEAANENLYWSLDGGETLNLISKKTYEFKSSTGNNNVVIYSSIGIGFVILLILIIVFVVLFLSKDNEKEDNSNDYMGSNEKNSRKENKTKKQREKDMIDQRNSVLDAL